MDREFLQRLPLDPRNDARNKPTRLTYLEHSSTAIKVVSAAHCSIEIDHA
jgi:hypothetical protein